jgi:hypothetical protein
MRPAPAPPPAPGAPATDEPASPRGPAAAAPLHLVLLPAGHSVVFTPEPMPSWARSSMADPKSYEVPDHDLDGEVVRFIAENTSLGLPPTQVHGLSWAIGVDRYLIRVDGDARLWAVERDKVRLPPGTAAPALCPEAIVFAYRNPWKRFSVLKAVLEHLGVPGAERPWELVYRHTDCIECSSRTEQACRSDRSLVATIREHPHSKRLRAFLLHCLPALAPHAR